MPSTWATSQAVDAEVGGAGHAGLGTVGTQCRVGRERDAGDDESGGGGGAGGDGHLILQVIERAVLSV